jgi:thioesterase domain-containing protein
MAQAAKLIDEWQPPIWTAPIVPPRTVLIRGREKMDENDVYREKRALGWEDYESDIMAAVLDVDGTHYSMWEKQHISTVDLQLHRACTLLEHSPMY